MIMLSFILLSSAVPVGIWGLTFRIQVPRDKMIPLKTGDKLLEKTWCIWCMVESALNSNLIYFHIYYVKVCIEYVGLINKVIDFISHSESFKIHLLSGYTFDFLKGFFSFFYLFFNQSSKEFLAPPKHPQAPPS